MPTKKAYKTIVGVRWNSIFLSVECLNEFLPEVEMKNRIELLSTVELRIIDNIKNSLNHVYAAVCFLSQNQCYLAKLGMILEFLIRKLDERDTPLAVILAGKLRVRTSESRNAVASSLNSYLSSIYKFGTNMKLKYASYEECINFTGELFKRLLQDMDEDIIEDTLQLPEPKTFKKKLKTFCQPKKFNTNYNSLENSFKIFDQIQIF
ncbi:MAG: hypothetical protein MHPSP_000252 [Paramarteilia canceri]